MQLQCSECSAPMLMKTAPTGERSSTSHSHSSLGCRASSRPPPMSNHCSAALDGDSPPVPLLDGGDALWPDRRRWISAAASCAAAGADAGKQGVPVPWAQESRMNAKHCSPESLVKRNGRARHYDSLELQGVREVVVKLLTALGPVACIWCTGLPTMMKVMMRNAKAQCRRSHLEDCRPAPASCWSYQGSPHCCCGSCYREWKDCWQCRPSCGAGLSARFPHCGPM